MKDMNEIFAKYKNIAVYGMSSNPNKPAYRVPMFLKSKGYNIFPVNPVADEIGGMQVSKKLVDVEGDIDILNVFRPSAETVKVVEEAIERRKRRGDIKLIWLQLDIKNDDAKKLAEEAGFEFIQDKCMHIEYNNL